MHDLCWSTAQIPVHSHLSAHQVEFEPLNQGLTLRTFHKIYCRYRGHTNSGTSRKNKFMKFKRVITGFLSRARSFVHASFQQNRTPLNRRYYHNRSLPKTLLLCLCFDEPSIAALGDSYRRNHPLESSSDWTREPTDPENLQKQMPSQRAKTRNTSLRDRIKGDFINGNLVQVQGWILSQTEAQQCALFSVRAPGRGPAAGKNSESSAATDRRSSNSQ